MAEYKGRISGIGNSLDRTNEITTDDLAIIRRFIIGHDYCVLNSESFVCTKIDNKTIKLSQGMMQAYGYLGFLDKAINIDFLLPSAIQYNIIYIEIDRSVVPNTCYIKIKNNQASPYINRNTFRQDVLSSIKTGVFQLPLWKLTLTNEGIVEIEDIREIKEKIKNVKESNDTKKILKSIPKDATIDIFGTDGTDRSNKIASTIFVAIACYAAIK